MSSQRRRGPDAELLELRVLDGPNRFFRRPAIKLEYVAGEPDAADAVAHAAGAAVETLHARLGLSPPRLAYRTSVDDRRALVAFPWRRRTISQAVAAAASRIALGRSSLLRELAGLQAVAQGQLAHVPSPRIPVVAITGTNGKSTTTRLIAHVAAAAGRQVGMTNSDGIFVRGELVEAGDWTGFGGAGRILSEPGLDLAVLETARGGILLRGLGYDHNEVAVVTNVSADHLGLQGIDTLEELAEVKAAIVRVTRRDGWAVLNADDPRVWAMRRQTKAGWYPFSLEASPAAVDDALARDGRAAVLSRGSLVLLRAGKRVPLAAARDLPVTFGGLSRHNVANTLAAAAACDALGLSPREIADGLRTFGREPDDNPGRLNLFARPGRLVLVDFAHNEAGLAGLLEVGRLLLDRAEDERTDAGVGTRRVRPRLRLALGTAGDRTDDILRRMGELAGRGADEVVICEKRHYLRGRGLEEMNDLFREGAARGGYRGAIPSYPDELTALQALLKQARAGDVVAVMTHVERNEIFAWLAEEGYRSVTAGEALGSGR